METLLVAGLVVQGCFCAECVTWGLLALFRFFVEVAVSSVSLRSVCGLCLALRQLLKALRIPVTVHERCRRFEGQVRRSPHVFSTGVLANPSSFSFSSWISSSVRWLGRCNTGHQHCSAIPMVEPSCVCLLSFDFGPFASDIPKCFATWKLPLVEVERKLQTLHTFGPATVHVRQMTRRDERESGSGKRSMGTFQCVDVCHRRSYLSW